MVTNNAKTETDTQQSTAAAVSVSTKTFNHVVQSLRNSTEAILQISESLSGQQTDIDTIKQLVYGVAQNQAKLADDIALIARHVLPQQRSDLEPLRLRPQDEIPAPQRRQPNGNGGGGVSGDTLKQALDNLRGELDEEEPPLRRAGQVARG